MMEERLLRSGEVSGLLGRFGRLRSTCGNFWRFVSMVWVRACDAGEGVLVAVANSSVGGLKLEPHLRDVIRKKTMQ